jgi:hypothetical protein
MADRRAAISTWKRSNSGGCSSRTRPASSMTTIIAGPLRRTRFDSSRRSDFMSVDRRPREQVLTCIKPGAAAGG